MDTIVCTSCRGTGEHWEYYDGNDEHNYRSSGFVRCHRCYGSGQVPRNRDPILLRQIKLEGDPPQKKAIDAAVKVIDEYYSAKKEMERIRQSKRRESKDKDVDFFYVGPV